MQLHRMDEWRVRIDREERRGMRTHVVAYASEPILNQIRKDLSLEQAMNVATLPVIVGHNFAMPDIHQGYGFPIGGEAATDYNHGVVSPGGVGFDINCGVRLMGTTLTNRKCAPALRKPSIRSSATFPAAPAGRVPLTSVPGNWTTCSAAVHRTWWS